MASGWKRLAPTPAWVRLAVVPVLAFVALSVDRQYLVDFWHHLARGRAMVEQGQLIDRDLFTYTVAGQPFQDVNWLSQLLYFGLFQWGGLALVQLANALTVALTLWLLVRLCRRLSGSLGAACAVGVFTFFGLWQILAVRPQTFSLLLFVVLYDVLDRAEQRRRWLLLPPLLLTLWVNLHGAFPAGLMLVGCFLLAAAWQAWRLGVAPWRDRSTLLLGLCLAGSTLATLVNPYGWRIYQYVLQTSGRAATRGILEWLPPRLDMLVGMAWAASLGLLVVLSVLAWRRGRRPRPREVFLILCFLPLACGSVRMVAWWLIVFAPFCSTLLVELLPRRLSAPEAEQPCWGAGLIFGLMLLAAVFSAPGLERYNPLLGFAPRQHLTEIGLERAQQHLAARAASGKIFSRFEWGEYLSWTGAPRFQVFMDGRIEIYPDPVWDQYLRLTSGAADWQQILDGYGVDYLVLDEGYHGESGLLARVEQSPAWQQTERLDGGILVFERRPALQAARGR
jgi:hypothetical protein